MDTYLEDLDFTIPRSSPKQRLQLSSGAFEKLGTLLPQLRKLSLEGIKGITHPAFEKLIRNSPLLTFLNLRRTVLEEESYRVIAECCAGRLVHLTCNFNVNATCAKHISQLSHLVELNLSGSKIQAPEIEEIVKGCPQIEILVLDYLTINSDSATKAIKDNCPNLINLSMRSITTNVHGDELVEPLLELKNLENFAITGVSSFTGHCFTKLTNPCKIKELAVSKTGVSDSSIQLILECCPYLENLEMNYCSDVKGVLEWGSNLKKISIGNQVLVIQTVLRCKSLEKFHCNREIDFPTNFVFDIPASPNLKEISVICHGLTSDQVKGLLKNVHGLKSLEMCSLSEISQNFLNDIAIHCTNLTELNLSNGSFGTDLNWKELFPRFQKLEKLILLSCFPDQTPISQEYSFVQTQFPWVGQGN